MKALIVICVHPERTVHIDFDVAPKFRLATFDYSGRGYVPDWEAPIDRSWSRTTAGKGEIFHALGQEEFGEFDFFSVIDDDVGLRVSDINHALFLGRTHELDLFQPSLSADSQISFPHLRQRPGLAMAETTFVEVMMPFFSRQAYEACRDLFGQSQSGWGMDIAWSDRRHKQGGRLRILHAVMATHLRPLTSHNWTMPNGLTAKEELQRVMQLNGLERYEIR